MVDSIKISLELADAAAQKSLSDFISKSSSAEKNFKKLGDVGKGTFNEITVGIGKSIGVFDIFAGNLAANVVVGAFNAMASAAGSLYTTFITDGVRAAQESEDALNSLNVALAQTGNYSEATSEEFVAFAKTIQATTAFEDDLIVKNIALLASLTNLDKDGLQQATTAATNLSAALGKDLGTTTEALAKAANGNTATIKKMGIQFEESGTKAGTFQNILQAIEDKLGGSATSKINTYSGALAQSKNAFGDLQEEIGGLITQNPAVVSAINAVTQVLTGSSASVNGGKQAYKELVAEGLILFIDAATATAIAVNTLVQAFNVGFNLIKASVLTGMAGAIGPLAIFSDTANEAFNSFKEGAAEAFGEVANLGGEGPLDETIVKLAGVGNAARDGFEQLKTGADSASTSIKNAADKSDELTEAQIRYNTENNKFVEDLANKSTAVKAGYDQQLAELTAFYDIGADVAEEKDKVNFEAKLEREQQYNEARQSLLDEQLEAENERTDASSVDDETKNQAKLASLAKFQTESLKLEADFSKKKLTIKEQSKKQEEAVNRATLSATGDLFGSLSQLAATGGKKNFAATKAFATASAFVNTYAGATRAYADLPFPASVIASAGIIAAGLAQVANIQNQSPPSYMSGGIVPGSSFTGDKVAARVNSGEMIINKSQQQELFEIVNGRGNSTGGITREEVASMVMEAANRPIVLQVNGREIMNVIRDETQSGRRI